MNDMHHFTTAISKIVSTPQEEETIIRGHRLSDLIREQPFVASAFLLLTGRLPDAGEARTLDAVLTACVDHGVTPAAAIGRSRRPIGCHDEAGHRRSRRAQRRTRRARRR
ncbi:citrate/2-methylcitrate synthase, partial [Bordetella pertussis]|uniref:citrate/2-methylcitrate synthase n=1 Tax=Bordetella pertussis TaxID=520 RepID=UPI000ABAE441